VPDLPPLAPSPPQVPGTYQGAYDTSNGLNAPGTPYDAGLDGAYDTSHVIGLTATVGPTVNNPSKFNDAGTSNNGRKAVGGGAGSGLDPYRRKRSVEKTTPAATANATATVTADADAAGRRTAWTHNVVNAGRTAKLVLDDGQINLGGKFKVIAAHDIQSDNINAGPQEVSLATPSSVCFTVASFTVAVTLFSVLLIVSMLVTFFVCFRLRRFALKSAGFSVSPPSRKQTKMAGKSDKVVAFGDPAAHYRIPAVLLTSSNCQQC
jgi:hypothetical protein